MAKAISTTSNCAARPTSADAKRAGFEFMKEQGSHIHCDDWQDAAEKWLSENISGALPLETDEEFTKYVGQVTDEFMRGAQQRIIAQAAWHGSQWGVLDVLFAAAHRFEKNLPKRFFGQSNAAYKEFVDKARHEFLRGLNLAVVVYESSGAEPDNSASGDFGLRTTAQAFSTAPRPQTATKKTRESEHA
jgi:hypothetical protein